MCLLLEQDDEVTSTESAGGTCPQQKMRVLSAEEGGMDAGWARTDVL